METTHTVSTYLIKKIHECGVKHIFGVPGDYVLGFYDQLIRAKCLEVINTCDELAAAFAADAYARVRGLGVVCVSGAPGTIERTRNPLLHHMVRDYDTQKKIFEHITVASTVLDKPDNAQAEIDRVLANALRYKRPVYIELPRDVINSPVMSVSNDLINVGYEEPSDPLAMAEAVEEAAVMINTAEKPVIVAGVEIQRFGLQDEVTIHRKNRYSRRGHNLKQVGDK